MCTDLDATTHWFSYGDFSVTISSFANLMKNLLFRLLFKRSTHIFGCHMSKTTISFSRIWLAVNYWRPKPCEISVQICNLKNWTPVTFKWHFSVLFCYALVRVCLLMPCGPLFGKGWPLGSRLWCLIVKLSKLLKLQKLHLKMSTAEVVCCK